MSLDSDCVVAPCACDKGDKYSAAKRLFGVPEATDVPGVTNATGVTGLAEVADAADVARVSGGPDVPRYIQQIS